MAKFKVGDRIVMRCNPAVKGVIINDKLGETSSTYIVRFDGFDADDSICIAEDKIAPEGKIWQGPAVLDNHLADEADKTIEHLLDDKNWQLPNAATMRILTKMADRILAIEKKMVDWEQRRYEIAKV